MFGRILVIVSVVVCNVGTCYSAITATNLTALRYVENNANCTEKIIFPDMVVKGKRNTNNCVNNICEEVSDYPDRAIKEYLDNSPYSFDSFEEVIDLANRIQDSVESLCGSIVKTVYPKQAVNKDYVTKYIVNDNDFKQGILTEQCHRERTPCRFSDSFPVGYKASCEQKFTGRRLLSLNGSEVGYDTFDMPSCCVCVITKGGN